MSIDSAAILEAIRALPREERVRLVEQLKHDLADDVRPAGDPNAIMGMMADEPDLMDRVCELAMEVRKQSRMRPVDG